MPNVVTMPTAMEPDVEPPMCGNGVVEGTEQCDDGNMVDGDDCEADCTITPSATCGDGTMDEGEACDDGNTMGGDGCEANCTLTPPPAVCGDGNIDTAAGETCDDGNTMGGDGCEADCTLPVAAEPMCGDGMMDEGEACDDGNTMGGDGCEADCTLPVGPAMGLLVAARILLEPLPSWAWGGGNPAAALFALDGLFQPLRRVGTTTPPSSRSQ